MRLDCLSLIFALRVMCDIPCDWFIQSMSRQLSQDPLSWELGRDYNRFPVLQNQKFAGRVDPILAYNLCYPDWEIKLTASKPECLVSVSQQGSDFGLSILVTTLRTWCCSEQREGDNWTIFLLLLGYYERPVAHQETSHSILSRINVTACHPYNKHAVNVF